MKHFKDLKVGDTLYHLHVDSDEGLQKYLITDIRSYNDPRDGNYKVYKFDLGQILIPEEFTDSSIFIDERFKGDRHEYFSNLDTCEIAIRGWLHYHESKVEDYRSILESLTETTKSCKDCKFYRENPRCMDEILCDEFKKNKR